MNAVATDLQHAVEDAAAHLYVWSLKDIPQDLRGALKDAAARETSVPGQRVLNTQPGGGRSGDGTSPVRMMRSRLRSISGSVIGTAESSAFVYGCSGFS